ncbi:hypothetical protein CBR_g58147 [Chara braunii]|uniref:Uncharacterized protein n=1 Tax=Chara braunii TaxID=69332 RepID=A0A388MEU9_CHABU|nr:hypothetical protein CBR_g58147 [Chara braunii]|eukprot:GBG93009.1 hypothetical protein CBR_g58147 [Chara braunii]
MSRRARNFTVDAPKETAMNLSWNWVVPAQTEEIMALRRRCSRPNLTSRVCRSCSSTRSKKVMVEGLGRRVVEHVAVGCSADGIEDVVGRRPGGVDCDAWGVSGVKVVAGGGVGRRIVGARTWLKGRGDSVQVEEGPEAAAEEEEVDVGWLDPVGREAWSLRAEVRKAVMVEKAGKEIGERELGLMGEGCCEVGEAYPLDAGDEDEVGNESRRDVEAEGANVLDELLGGAGLAEVAKWIDVVIDGLLRTEGGDEKVGPLKEGDAGKAVGSAVVGFG